MAPSLFIFTGFAESQEAYNPYPNALLSMRYINEVGKMVIGEAYTEAGEIKEGDDVIANTQLTGEVCWVCCVDSVPFAEFSHPSLCA